VELLEWWNLIFLLPALAAVLYVLLLAVGAAPVDDAGFDFDADVEGDGGHDLLSVLGLGRVPLSLILVSFCMLWGIIGWFAVGAFSTIWPQPGTFIWPSLVAALLGAALLTRLMTNVLGRIMPRTESYGAGARELVGRLAEARYAITATGGTVQVYDQHGSLHEVPARVLPGEAPIPAGARVILFRYDDVAGSYLVTQDDAFDSLMGGLPAA
jgi:membrane protein implicated in regulation of membrane protease activity